jgi:hypothetical protein
MPQSTLEPAMAKKSGRPKTGKDNGTVKLNVSLIRQARYIASLDGEFLSDWLNDALKPIIEKRMRAVGVEITKKPEGK